jgi:ribonuclease E
MANKMLIDATHPEETRVVVLRGNRVEEFDFESAQRKQLRGNIYLAKVTRVEPSLQAAFVDYGGNRHGFLAFSEIHPDYYQIPVADRQALIDEEGRAQRAAEDEADRRSNRHRRHDRSSAARRDDEVVRSEAPELHGEVDDPPIPELVEDDEGPTPAQSSLADLAPDAAASPSPDAAAETIKTVEPKPQEGEASADSALHFTATIEPESNAGDVGEPAAATADDGNGTHSEALRDSPAHAPAETGEEDEEVVESVGGADALEEVPDRAPRYRRQYKIQEVIKRRQVMLVQVVKEERGTKGAALTTYLSLAGRYSVLMPNTARGGGISRKITSGEDRSRLKEIAQELEVPEGMGVILRTAGASRTKTEIKRDFEYLLRLWETVRDLTLKSTAPKLVYEEGSLIKRSIRDLYGKEIDEVVVAGAESYEEAKEFMRMLMPSHARNVKPYSDTQPLLSRYGVENQLDAMFSPVVQLRSGGYIVLNQAEALVAIDVNSGRATREHHIEDTALKTNLEAADEIARQLRLRDLAGLIVIDFIDMDEKRNNRAVERRLKECLKQDRARIQVGRISHFGLLEMSRQRIRTSVLESSTEKCPYCGGSGHVRSVSSLALQVLRSLEEQLIKGATHNLIVRTRPDVALYVLNQKRAHLRGLEERFAITITISADTTLTPPQTFVIDRGEQVHSIEAARALAAQSEAAAAPLEEEDNLEPESPVEGEAAESEAAEDEAEVVEAVHGEGGQRRRRRRRRGRGRNGAEVPSREEAPRHVPITEAGSDPHADVAGDALMEAEDFAEAAGDHGAGERGESHRDGERRRRRRGRRGGRRNRHEGDGDHVHDPTDHSPQPEHGFAPDEVGAPPAPEAELKEAVADLDAAPSSSFPSPAAEPEPPRRRSTVREPAPMTGSGDAGAPVPPSTSASDSAPTISEINEGEDAARPRRSGWWSRRSAGG